MVIEKVLIADDDLLVRTFLSEVLSRKKIDVTAVEGGKKAINALKEGAFDLIITDMMMPDATGIDVLKAAKEHSPNTLVIVITGHGSIENAVKAMRLGAFHYLLKPFAPGTIEAIIEKAGNHQSLIEENRYLRQHAHGRSSTQKVIAESPSMKQILKDAARIAQSNANVFISGESGTGKEVIAHAVHFNSLRANNTFVKVNCAAIPETLIESEFFGHEKGAFTGASTKRMGRFELANNGTLLLDEITEIPIGMQAKLLRVLQEQEFERVGSSKPVEIDVRVVSTSNRDIKEAITDKFLREDLYYRLNVVPIHLPPLRERPEDIIPLAEYFLEKMCIENHAKQKTFTKDAEKKLLTYTWPGNVRELSNVVERAIVMTTASKISGNTLYLDGITTAGSNPVGTTLEELERKLIIETLQEQKHDHQEAAKLLGITLKDLAKKLSQHSLDA